MKQSLARTSHLSHLSERLKLVNFERE
jgi:hypothetical protein